MTLKFLIEDGRIIFTLLIHYSINPDSKSNSKNVTFKQAAYNDVESIPFIFLNKEVMWIKGNFYDTKYKTEVGLNYTYIPFSVNDVLSLFPWGSPIKTLLKGVTIKLNCHDIGYHRYIKCDESNEPNQEAIDKELELYGNCRVTAIYPNSYISLENIDEEPTAVTTLNIDFELSKEENDND